MGVKIKRVTRKVFSEIRKECGEGRNIHWLARNHSLSIEVVKAIVCASTFEEKAIPAIPYTKPKNLSSGRAPKISETLFLSRNEKIIEMRKKGHPLERIGEEFGLTRERVRQIVKNSEVEISAESAKQERKNGLQRQLQKENQIIQAQIVKNWDRYKELTFDALASELGCTVFKLKKCLSRIQYVYLQANQESSIARTWTDEKCLQSLRDAATFAFPLTVLKYRRLLESGTINGPTVALYWQRFGSWVAACEKAGVEFGEAQREYDRTWSDTELMKFVRWFMYERKDGRWSIENFELWANSPEINGPSVALLRLRLGSWSQIRVLALELPLPEFNMHEFTGMEPHDK